MSPVLPQLLYTGISNQVVHRPFDRAPRRSGEDALAMREIHSLEDIDEAIEERAKPKFGYGVEIGERLQPGKKNCCGLRLTVEGLCQIAPLLSESVDCRLPAFLGLFSDLDSEINERRDSNKHRR